VIKMGFEDDQDGDAAIDLAILALFQAADEDSATGGPDVVRGIYPLVGQIDADGYRELNDDTVAARVRQIITERRMTPVDEEG
jgi:proteasome beta subunit